MHPGPSERTRYYQTRPRRVPPEFCSDEVLECCSLLAALLLYRLISQADDQGRLPGQPRYVKGICFPMRPDVTERKVEGALDELVQAGFVIRYVVEHRVFLQIDKWFDLQGKWGQRRTYPSRYPPPANWTSDWVNAGANEDEVRALDAQEAREVRPPSPPSSPSPSSLASSSASPSSAPPEEGALRAANPGQTTPRVLTEEEALALGTALAVQELARRRR